MPASAEGVFVAGSLDRPGVWIRSGLNGVVTGLDLANAMAAVPGDLDRDVVRRLFLIAELEYVAAMAARESDDDDG